VFAEHAESETYELGRSRISKLWFQDTTAKSTVFHFDRGVDISAASDEVQAMVDFLCEGIADLVFG
jgi:hypothetical protein